MKAEFLKLGINFSRSLLKGGTYEDYGFDTCELQNFLCWWVLNSPNYVEVSILKYKDGTWATYIDSKNDALNSHIGLTRMYNPSNNETVGWKYTDNGKELAELGHTHGAGNSGPNPTPPGWWGDGDTIYPALSQFIYYDCAMHYF